DLDGVSICTPNIAHHRTSVDALNAGKHVLTEKPMAVTLEQAIEMVEASKRSAKILTVGFQPRYDPNHKEIKRIVQSGTLGKVYHVQTGGGRRRGMPGRGFIRKDISGSGAIADIGCYSLDLAMDALGYLRNTIKTPTGSTSRISARRSSASKETSCSISKFHGRCIWTRSARRCSSAPKAD
ncbi:MAG: gfo/Idh/MocA family oxidoreductase, partial [Paenibacillus sp.]|nr:gfo/Idh/MocA family oxidoreductase [Paenibacillus sp.]